ncbi:hypothetical protein GCK72_023965 [Caenorhabditis remanei]|uniref:Uncharacterized protein n=1 Tax=Caenorhabditis remanei TaxID=31234 RepID=A0A6A5FXW2_CAERE|nr:hypothetical protein GCK72_023965 [Caenorhabditis remanei]KAF1747500.1 hypothetical protein GCK72_023965 [Caenorhabditis remanei]
MIENLKAKIEIQRTKLQRLLRDLKSEETRIEKRRLLYDTKTENRIKRRDASKQIKKQKRELADKREKLREEMEAKYLG